MELQEEGYRFHPTDSELLTFLLRFIANKDLCDNGFITECDVYKQEPWITYGDGRHCGGEDDGHTSIFRYFITPRHKKEKDKENLPTHKKEKDKENFRRVVGEKLGTWKQQDKGKKVMSKQNKAVIIGYKKSLFYDTKKCCPDGGKWLMKEYAFCEAIVRKFRNSEFRNYVICAIKRKSKKDSSNGSRSRNVITSMDFSDEEKANISGVNSVEPQMDQEYKANSVEPMVQIQEGEENDSRIDALLENQDPPVIRDMRNEDYGIMTSIPPPINVVENPVVECDDVEMQIQGEGIGVLEFENNRVNEDHIAYRELQANDTISFVELLSGGGDSAPFPQIQQVVMPENNVPEMFENQPHCQPTPQEESETLCETEESSLVVDLAEALLDHTPMKDRLDAIRESKSTLILDQQSWQSKAHLQDMLL